MKTIYYYTIVEIISKEWDLIECNESCDVRWEFNLPRIGSQGISLDGKYKFSVITID